MAEADQQGEETASEQPLEARKSFLQKTWPLWAAAIGLSTFLLALLLWAGPISSRARARTLAAMQEARRQFAVQNMEATVNTLERIEPDLWRAPEEIPAAYYMFGVALGRLANPSALKRAEELRRRGLAYLEACEKMGGAGWFGLDLYERMGVLRCKLKEYQEASGLLEFCVKERRQIASMIARRRLEAALAESPVDETRLEVLHELWSTIPGLSSEERDRIAKAGELLDERKLDELAEYLVSPKVPWLPDDPGPDLLKLDRTAEAKLAVWGAQDAAEYLVKARARNQRQLSQDLRWSIECRAALSPSNLELAIEEGWQRLALDELTPAERDRAKARQATLLLKAGQPREARTLLKSIAPGAMPNGVWWQLLGQSYFEDAQRLESLPLEKYLEESERARHYADLYREAIGALARRRQDGVASRLAYRALAALEPERLHRLAVQANYLGASECFSRVLEDLTLDNQDFYGEALLRLGECQRRLGKLSEATATLERVIEGFPGSDLERAARFERAAAYFEQKDPRTLEAFRSAAEATAQGPRAGGDRDLSRPRVANLVQRCWRGYRDAGDWAAAMELAEIYSMVAPAGAAEKLLAEAARGRADQLARQAETQTYRDAEQTRAEARRVYRIAGDHFAAAAEADRASASFPELVWQSAEASFLGHDYRAATERAAAYLDIQPGGSLDLRARVVAARSQMSLGEYANAQRMLERALALHPRSPDRFDARIALAQTLMELARQTTLETGTDAALARRERYDQAQSLLLLNTDGLELEPTSREWRVSLFLLGGLLLERERFGEAIDRLREALRRFPDAEESTLALYQIAEAYRRSAREPAERYAEEPTPRGREYFLAERDRRLEHAGEYYQALGKRLSDLQERRPLAPEEQTLLRAAYFAQGDVWMELEDWAGAIAAYTNAASRFQDRPECLAAYVQIANAYWKSGRDDDAKSTLRQARWVLGQLDESAFADSALSRDQWQRRLSELIGGP